MKKLLFTMVTISIMYVSSAAQPQMTLREDGRFKIVQFTDTHIDLQIDTMRTVFDLVAETVTAERPDLVVFTGDVVTQNSPRGTWIELAALMDSLDVPWTVVFGNHDSESDMSNDQIYRLIRDSEKSVMESGPDSIAGTGNFVVELISNKTDDRPSHVLYFFDTHSMACEQLDGMEGYAWIDESQIGWYRAMADRYAGIPALTFLHIPLPEYRLVEGRLVGSRNEKVCSPELNTGLFASMRMRGDVMGVFAGHDHTNDFVAGHHGIALAYGRFSGNKATTYGNLEPGARIIIVRAGCRSFETYVRLKSGQIIDNCIFPDSFRE